MWRNYGNYGYNLTIDKNFFIDIYNATQFTTKDDFDLNVEHEVRKHNVIYKLDEQEEKISILLDEMNYFITNYVNDVSLNTFLNIFYSYLLDQVCFFKREGHSPENEFRIAINFLDGNYNERLVRIREAKGLSIPYIELKFDKKYIKNIKVGPRIISEYTQLEEKNNLELFLKTINRSDISVDLSKLKLRY